MEKFGLLNLLKAIETLSPSAADKETDTKAPAQPPRQNTSAEKAPAGEDGSIPNVMASVLERHETISNRIRNNRR